MHIREAESCPASLVSAFILEGHATFTIWRAAAANRMTIAYYSGGHMVYSDRDAVESLNADMRAFVQGKPVRSMVYPDIKPRP
jgi:hypothetical protein